MYMSKQLYMQMHSVTNAHQNVRLEQQHCITVLLLYTSKVIQYSRAKWQNNFIFLLKITKQQICVQREINTSCNIAAAVGTKLN